MTIFFTKQTTQPLQFHATIIVLEDTKILRITLIPFKTSFIILILESFNDICVICNIATSIAKRRSFYSFFYDNPTGHLQRITTIVANTMMIVHIIQNNYQIFHLNDCSLAETE